jgi:hypothetical protein
MARLARVVVVDIAHHVTQRGNARRFILESDSDKLIYVGLLPPDVQSGAPGRCTEADRLTSVNAEKHSWKVCVLLERESHRQVTPGKVDIIPVRLTSRICGELCATPN